MPFLTGKINLTLYTDTNQTEFPLERVPQIEKEFSDNDVSEVQFTVISLAAAGTQDINLNGVGTVTRAYIYSNTSDLTLTINGSATTFTWKAGIPGFMPLTISSLSITNASATDATTATVVLITE